jgi:hypothetical protein
MKQYLIEFEHTSRHLGQDGFGLLLVSANSFEEACSKIEVFSVPKVNPATGYKWNEYFENAKNFVNLTID